MGRRTKPKILGLTINISPDRKHGNGGVGGGRSGSSGKKAVIKKHGEPDVTLKGSTSKDLLRQVRSRYGVPSSVVINKKGETFI